MKIFIGIGSPHLYHFQQIVLGIRDYALRNCPQWEFLTAQQDFYQSFIMDPEKFSQADGMIVTARFKNKVCAAIQDSQTPAVNVCHPAEHLPIPLVTVDSYEVGRKAGEYFAHPDIVNTLYVGCDYAASQLRHKGFADVLQTQHRQAPHIVIADGQEARTFRLCKQIQQGLKRLRKLTGGRIGVFAYSDSFAHTVLRAAQEIKLRIPQDVAILGCDNDPLICSFSSPQLSSIPVNSREIGFQAAKSLDSILHGKQAPAEILLSPQPIEERASSSFLTVDDPVVAAALSLIHHNLETRLMVGDLLDKLHVSRRCLEAHFKQHLGRSPNAEIRRVKIRKAVQLLKENKLTNSAIAQVCGFGSTIHFEQAVRRQTGLRPSEYRPKTRWNGR